MLVEVLESRRLLSAVTLDGRIVEGLDRGVVAVNQGSGNVYVGWRLLATDPDDVTFNVYRSANGGTPVKVNSSPIGATTNLVNTGVSVSQSNTYFVRRVIDGVEQVESSPDTFTLPANAPTRQFLSVPLQVPAGGTTPDGVAYTYSANDASPADLDGDGDYELVVKWDPSNAKDNAHEGYTGNVYVDAYTLEGTRLWRIDLGRNIRAGAHYTQIIAYDLDSDGRAEVAMKTADGTVDGVGTVIGDASADYRNTSGRILSGPEFLTVFDGLTGRALATTNYVPPRGSVNSWGDDYGNRVDRFLAAVAYLDGQRPSLIMSRGYYAKTVVAAWDWRGGQLTHRWTFDSTVVGQNTGGQGNHNLSVADVDDDGRDEIVFGAMTINDNGGLLYNTRIGHGDAMHVSDMDPDRPGLEVFKANESPSQYGTNGGALWDARTGEILGGVPGTGDVGRGVAFDVDPRYRGYEMWTTGDAGLYNVDGTRIQDRGNAFVNFGVWWDADPLRELLDGTTIADWRITNGVGGRVNYVFAPANASSNNGTKATPGLSGDLFGDWREEVVWRQSDSTALQIWTTTIPSTFRLDTLAHDSHYRLSLAWQNVAYNQPPHTSYFLGDGMLMPPAAPTGLGASATSPTSVQLSWAATATATGYSVKRATSVNGPYVTIASGLTAPGFVDATAAPNTTYQYFVTASNAAGGSLNSARATANTPADATAPTVTAVFVAGSAWNSAYRNSLATSGAGEAAFGYRIPAAEQTRTLAWSNLNQVSIRFSEQVAVADNDLLVSGINVASYGVAGFSYDPATFTATWTLDRSIPNDKLALNLDADAGTGVTDAAGNRLDGEWTNPVSPSFSGDTFPSGNGTAGGDFVFDLRVLPGDIDRNGAVNIFDYNILKPNLNFTARGVAGGDINGDNLVNIFDFNDLKTYLGKTTPA